MLRKRLSRLSVPSFCAMLCCSTAAGRGRSKGAGQGSRDYDKYSINTLSHVDVKPPLNRQVRRRRSGWQGASCARTRELRGAAHGHPAAACLPPARATAPSNSGAWLRPAKQVRRNSTHVKARLAPPCFWRVDVTCFVSAWPACHMVSNCFSIPGPNLLYCAVAPMHATASVEQCKRACWVVLRNR